MIKGYVKMFKLYTYIGAAVFVLGLTGGVIYKYHFEPINNLSKRIDTLIIDNKAKDITINNLGVEIVQLIEQNKIVNFESYFTGLADANNSTSNNLIF